MAINLPLGLLILRIGIGIMFMLHGAPKLLGGPEQWEKQGRVMQNLGIDFLPAFWGFMAGFSDLSAAYAWCSVSYGFRPVSCCCSP